MKNIQYAQGSGQIVSPKSVLQYHRLEEGKLERMSPSKSQFAFLLNSDGEQRTPQYKDRISSLPTITKLQVVK